MNIRILTKMMPFLFLGLVFISCEKEDSEEKLVLEDRLTGDSEKSWLLFSIFIEGVDQTEFELENCERDDEHIFRYNNTYARGQGNIKCDPTGPNIEAEGSWSMNANGERITLSIDNVNREYEIIQMTEESMELKISENNLEHIYHYKTH